MDAKSGSLRALCELTTTTLPGIQQQLDSLAQALVTTVNGIHRTGYTLTGATGTDFFDPAGVTAQSIALAPAVAASGDAIAAAGTAAPGDSDIAQQLAGLSTTGIAALGGKSFRDFYVDLAGSVGADVSGASQNTDAYQAMVDQADTMRASVSGVSVDEEMVALISQQQAYSAAARIVKVADDDDAVRARHDLSRSRAPRVGGMIRMPRGGSVPWRARGPVPRGPAVDQAD